MNTRVTVKQYNLLSQELCTSDWFPNCDPDAVDPEKRYLRIYTKILGTINEGGVICLQEISQTWLTRLIGLFESKNYALFYRLYGQRCNDYMGVRSAWPRSKYILQASQIVRVGDFIPEPVRESTVSKDTWWDFLDYYGIRFWKVLQSVFGGSTQRPPVDQWDVSRKKYNMMVMVSLIDRDSGNDKNAFTVATYHMPCAFRQPTVMALHSYWAVRIAQEWSRILNGRVGRLIFAADMNIKPESEVYAMITSGKMVEELQTVEQGGLTAVNDWGSWSSEWGPMNSMYVLKNGEEPKYTNYARTARSESDFIATLDYIFLSSDWDVVECMELPDKEANEQCQTPLPTIDEPSDHLMIGGIVEVNNVA